MFAKPLAGTHIVITRPAGTGAALARRVRALGGAPILLPGSSLRAAPDAASARTALRAALAGDIAIFTSPAAVRFARRLAPLHGAARALAPGRGTQAALLRAGLAGATAPSREDSEGILALAALQNVHGLQVAIIGAAGGRGLLARELAARGAVVTLVHVYQRLPARLGPRHAQALVNVAPARLYALISSSEALANILAQLPHAAALALLAGTATVSSARLAAATAAAGFARTLQAHSAAAGDLLACVGADQA